MLYHKVCVICGKSFVTRISNKISCSPDCVAVKNKLNDKNRYYRTRDKKYNKKHFCAVCGKDFTPSFEGEKHCSDECRCLSPAFLAAKIIFKIGG